jgi:CheY-like chemotaxis protein
MARVLIAEPYPEVRELLSLIVRRLGHSTVFQGDDLPGHVDVMLAEPAANGSLELAHSLRGLRPELPIVVVSFLPQPATWTALAPAAYVLKPFTVVQLEAAVSAALGADRRTTAAA